MIAPQLRRLSGISRIFAAAVILCGCSEVMAGKLVLKSGYEIPGTPVKVPGMTSDVARANRSLNVPQTPYWMIDDGIRRYFVHRQNVRPGLDGVDQSDDSSRYITFNLTHLRSRLDSIPTWIGTFADKQPWDEYGRCVVSLTTPNGREDIHLGIKRLDPRYLEIQSTSHDWEFGLAPTMVPIETLRTILHGAVNKNRPEDRLGIIRFFLQSGQLAGAREEMQTLKQEFPDYAARADEMQAELLKEYGLQAMEEVKLRQVVGQHRLAYFLAQRMQAEEIDAGTLRDAQLAIEKYDKAAVKGRQALSALKALQAELPDDQMNGVSAIRAAIESELNFDSLPRLEPMLLVLDDDTLTAGERLALGFSGWLLGPADATTNLNEAISLWEARFLLLQLLHPDTDPGDQKLLARSIEELEGVSTAVLAKMIPLLPTPIELEPAEQGRQLSYELAPTPDSDTSVRYTILLPPEYDPLRAYPTIVALRAGGQSIEAMLAVWGGTVERPGPAQRHGYIVIAPDFAPGDPGDYDYGRVSHDIVLRALFDARRRFRIDSDRVFLTGHGVGGDAAFDLGLSHPDLWAGVIPFTGKFQHAAWLERKNCKSLPFYIVAGEKDRDTLQVNDSPLSHRMATGSDLVYCEYKARGFEPYTEEFPRVFDWMARLRRQPTDRDMEQQIVNDFDNRVGWLKWLDPPATLSETVLWGNGHRPPRALLVTGKISAGNETHNAIYVRHPGKRTVVWLSPEFVDYEKRLKVYVNGNNPFNDFAKPSVIDLLEDFRDRGDRERLYWTKLGM
ncbi:MAG: hypothetical protein R3B90_18770 [Planctomycetaceae bacterium]